VDYRAQDSTYLGASMDRKEILDQLVSYLNLGLGGNNIFEGNYKYDLFRLFKTAYANGYLNEDSHERLHGDAILDYLNEHVKRQPNRDAERTKLSVRFLCMWDE